MTAPQPKDSPTFKPLFTSNYLSLSTLKKSGQWVETPVWFAGNDHTLFIFSASKAGKVKRLCNFAQVKVAPCTVLGKTFGDSISGQAILLNDRAAINKAHQALLQRYGWQMRWTDLLSKLSGKFAKRQYIAVSLSV